MQNDRVIVNRVRSAEMEIQFAQRAFDGSLQARERYGHALQELELALREAHQLQRIAAAQVALTG
ncbi:MAG: hypothetical protein WBV82_11515 [Myxococcaceae bacterium]